MNDQPMFAIRDNDKGKWVWLLKGWVHDDPGTAKRRFFHSHGKRFAECPQMSIHKVRLEIIE